MLQLLHISSLGSPYILLWYCRLWECSIEALVAEIHDACTLMSLWSDWCPWGHHEGYWAFLWYQASSACCCCLSPCLSWVSCFDYGGFFDIETPKCIGLTNQPIIVQNGRFCWLFQVPSGCSDPSLVSPPSSSGNNVHWKTNSNADQLIKVAFGKESLVLQAWNFPNVERRRDVILDEDKAQADLVCFEIAFND